jgi:phospholipid/cholesterol/gamma-HCH transport system permease protein
VIAWLAGAFRDVGDAALFFFHAFRATFTPPFRVRIALEQMLRLGARSLPIVSITAFFTGLVLAYQTAYQMRKYGAEVYVASLVALSIFRELGPVLTALVVAGRCGAGITAEIGSMRVTEQIDAVETMGVDPMNYLVAPRFVAMVFMLPVLTVYADLVGYFGGFLIGVFQIGISADQFLSNTTTYVVASDLLLGLVKTFVFGGLISLVGCYMGFRSRNGAEGVGQATTMSVVVSSILIFISEFYMTSFLFKVE